MDLSFQSGVAELLSAYETSRFMSLKIHFLH